LYSFIPRINGKAGVIIKNIIKGKYNLPGEGQNGKNRRGFKSSMIRGVKVKVKKEKLTK
jgi:hypothetical protein